MIVLVTLYNESLSLLLRQLTKPIIVILLELTSARFLSLPLTHNIIMPYLVIIIILLILRLSVKPSYMNTIGNPRCCRIYYEIVYSDTH